MALHQPGIGGVGSDEEAVGVEDRIIFAAPPADLAGPLVEVINELQHHLGRDLVLVG